MIELIKDIIKQHYPMILTCGLMFLAGVGIGGAITDALNKWTRKEGKSNDETYMDRRGKENIANRSDEQRDLGTNRDSR